MKKDKQEFTVKLREGDSFLMPQVFDNDDSDASMALLVHMIQLKCKHGYVKNKISKANLICNLYLIDFSDPSKVRGTAVQPTSIKVSGQRYRGRVI